VVSVAAVCEHSFHPPPFQPIPPAVMRIRHVPTSSHKNAMFINVASMVAHRLHQLLVARLLHLVVTHFSIDLNFVNLVIAP
jgi:hypothetical protein